MPWFEVHTDESVHGVYHVNAANDAEARRMFEEGSWVTDEERVEQTLYEAYSAEVTEVKELAESG